MTETEWQKLAVLAFLWLAYFVLHSTLASLRLKSWVARHYPQRMPLYRLYFNILATLALLPLLWQMARYPGPPLWAWQGWAAWLSNGLALAAVLGFIHSLKYYDSQEFLGFRQWKSNSLRVEDQEGFHLSPYHRFVRHPWYGFALVLIWTRDMNAAMALSGALMTLYFIVGSRLEEAKLLAYHGAVYRRYRERVPGLIPLPWKTLTAQEAAELAKAAAHGENSNSVL